MRVLTVLESASRADGGIFEAELALQRELALQSGMTVGVVALRDEFTEADAARWNPLAPRLAEVWGPQAFGYGPGFADLLDPVADLLYCAALWKYPGWAVLNWQKSTGRPVVIAPHGSLDAWALNNSRWKKRVAAWLFKNEQLRRATCFRALCAAEADAIRSYGLTQRIEVVPNGVVLPIESATGKTGGIDGRKSLLFLGRLHPKKGLAGALRAWAEIPSAKLWQLVIAGWDQGGHERELKALCAGLGLQTTTIFPHEGQESGVGRNRNLPFEKLQTPPPGAADVVFAGPAFGAEKDKLLQRADAFLLPSHSEGLPMSVLEAWAHRLPVVMTPECNLPEGFASGAALEIRNPPQGKSEWKGLRALLEMTDGQRRAMGLRGRTLVEERFTWPKVAFRMREVFESVL